MVVKTELLRANFVNGVLAQSYELFIKCGFVFPAVEQTKWRAGLRGPSNKHASKCRDQAACDRAGMTFVMPSRRAPKPSEALALTKLAASCTRATPTLVCSRR